MKAKTKTKAAEMSPKLRDSIAYSALHPKSLCTCGHNGDGAVSQHTGFGGHGSCIFGDACGCGQFTWGGWTYDYKHYMIKRGHKEGVR